MPKRSSDELFQLVKSLSKAEKRNFKLFASRNSGSADLKIVQLFDLLDRLDEYEDDSVLKKNKHLRDAQLPNLKAHLYRQVLASLRVVREDTSLENQLHEQLEYARILYNKGLFNQCLKTLARTKETARAFHQNTFWLQALIFEKKIESLHITRSTPARAAELAAEVDTLTARLAQIGSLSNLALELYSWYIRYGHARNADDARLLETEFGSRFPAPSAVIEGFYSQLYLVQAQCWRGFILQNFLQHYRAAQRWFDLFVREPQMRRVEPIFYVKSLHNLLLAHFMLKNVGKFAETLANFEAFAEAGEATANDNLRVQTFVYLQIARLNGHFLHGTFSEGLRIVPEIESLLADSSGLIDRHRELVFFYKIACLHFGAGDPASAIDYLNRIINGRPDLRSDLQCYARLLHLIAHYEWSGGQPEHFPFLENLIKSVYRFMGSLQNLGTVEREIFAFLRRSFSLRSPAAVRRAFGELRERLLPCQNDPFESRSFMYLDIISWLESRMEGVAVQVIIRRKFKNLF